MTQGEIQDNAVPSVVEGLKKRPPTKHISEINATSFGDAFFHTINRDSTERFVTVVTNGGMKVYDLDGSERSVSFPNGAAYLNAPTPATSIKAVTVADSTFIVNTSIQVSDDGSTTLNRDPEAFIWVRAVQNAAQDGDDIVVRVDGIIVATAELSRADNQAASTDDVAQHLYNVMIDNLPASEWEIILENGPAPNTQTSSLARGSKVYVRNKQGNDFDISVADAFGGENVLLFKGRTQVFQDLPKTFFVGGFHVTIEGDPGLGEDVYYVQWDEAEDAWKETTGQGVKTAINAATMPHQLISNPDGTFTFRRATWETRVVGDDDTNPLPTFVGRTIADVFFHRNRLGFISDENVIFSRAGLFFDFFRPTVSQILDDDPIDVGVAHTRVSILSHAVPFNESLLLFADQTQFVLDTGGDLLTPTTASITVATEYENDKLVRPVGAGRSVFFATTRGRFSSVKEYIVEGVTEILDATDTSSQIPRLIPKGIFKIAASTNESLLVALSDEKPNEVYLYAWYWQGNEKFQSAWGRWIFPTGTKVLNADFIQSQLFLLMQYPEDNSIHLESMDLEPSPVEDVADENFIFHLDRQVLSATVPDSYNPVTDETTFTLPYACDQDMEVVVGIGGGPTPGEILPHTKGAANEIIVPGGNFTAFGLVFGVRYEARYRFSPFFIRQGQPGAEQAVVSGRLQIHNLILSYARTGYFRVEVMPTGRVLQRGVEGAKSVYEFTGFQVGHTEFGIGDIPLSDGVLTAGVGGMNLEVKIDIINDSYMPMNLLSAEWQGSYYRSY